MLPVYSIKFPSKRFSTAYDAVAVRFPTIATAHYAVAVRFQTIANAHDAVAVRFQTTSTARNFAERDGGLSRTSSSLGRTT